MKLALFDLDDTLLDGDSEVQWCALLAERGVCDLREVEVELERYRNGAFDIERWVALQLGLLVPHSHEVLLAWRAEFMARIRTRVAPQASGLLAEHARAGHELAIVTATHRFLAQPIAELLGVPHAIATEPELAAGRFTGRCLPPACFGAGKFAHVERWLARRGASWRDVEESWFYSDSHHDLPLLERVTHPIVVRPSAPLAEHARRRGWRCIGSK